MPMSHHINYLSISGLDASNLVFNDKNHNGNGEFRVRVEGTNHYQCLHQTAASGEK
jgi:hypothetical protein